MKTRDRIISALTQYDARQAKRGRQHNPYALGLYFEAFDRAEQMTKKGQTWEQALNACFNDRLLDVVLRAVEGGGR
jgi:hypothetical protein